VLRRESMNTMKSWVRYSCKSGWFVVNQPYGIAHPAFYCYAAMQQGFMKHLLSCLPTLSGNQPGLSAVAP